jgi:putative DNA-invertase from lambdoid prophage Rac
MTVYAYTRVSTDIQAEEGESLAAQDRQIQGWAMMHGLTIADVFVEAGVSGSVPIADRPEGGRLFKALKKGDTIVAAKLDRMFRSALDALQTVDELKDKGVSLVLLDLGGDVVANGMSKLFLTITAAFAEAERDRIRERISSAKRDARARGRYLGGTVPFGFVLDAEGTLQPVEAEQAAIATIRSMKAQGASVRAMQSAVNQQMGRWLSTRTIAKIAAQAA